MAVTKPSSIPFNSLITYAQSIGTTHLSKVSAWVQVRIKWMTISLAATFVPYSLAAAIMRTQLVFSIERAHFLALCLGLFNFSYDGVRNKFKEKLILSTFHRCCKWIICILALVIVWAYYLLLPGLQSWTDTARIQDRVLWFMNIVQLYLGVLLTHTNHSLKQSHLLRMLNRVVKCNGNLARLLGKEGDLLGRFLFFRNIRTAVVIVDILTTCYRPFMFQLVTYEWKTLAVVNKAVLMSSFLGQHQIQAFLGSTFDRMEDFVRRRSGDSLSAKDYRLLSKICSQLHKIRLSSNAYHGAFGLISYVSLIRTICFFYSSFSAMFTGGIMRADLLSTLIYYFIWMIVPGLAPLIDIVLLGLTADAVNGAAKDFYFTVYLIDDMAEPSPETCQLTEIILQKQHLENMQTLITSGMVMDSGFSFQIVFEAFTWVIVTFVYSAGRFNTASMAMVGVNFGIKRLVYMVLLLACVLCGLAYCIYKAIVAMTRAWKWMNILCFGDGNQ